MEQPLEDGEGSKEGNCIDYSASACSLSSMTTGSHSSEHRNLLKDNGRVPELPCGFLKSRDHIHLIERGSGHVLIAMTTF
jgi:hypothetical protein